MRIEFFVPGHARTSGSKRSFVVKDKYTGVHKAVTAPADTRQTDWMGSVKWYGQKAACRMIPIRQTAFRMTAVFYRNRPDGHFRMRQGQLSTLLKPQYVNARPSGAPDGLKLTRAVEDSIQKVVYHNDAQICEHHIYKVYCDRGGIPGVKIIVETFDEAKGVLNNDQAEKAIREQPGAGERREHAGAADRDDGSDKPDHDRVSQGSNLFHQSGLHGAG